jgi:ABC-type branched-subunit amino acid transport system permease subunit
VVGGAVAFLIGLPALRIRGLSLAIATLAFAVAAQSYLFKQEMFGSRFGLGFDRPKIGPFDLGAPSGREFAYLCLVVVFGMVWLTRNLERRRGGRALLAVRENEKSAAVLGVPVRGYKLLAFTFSGVLAAWAGYLYGMLNPPVQASAFPPVRSLELVAMVIIGGLGSPAGAVLGAVYVVGIPRMFPGSDIAPLLATGFGLLLVLLVRPGGLWSLVTGLRDFYVWALTVEDRAFKGPLSHLVPPDVPTAGRLQSVFVEGDPVQPRAREPAA